MLINLISSNIYQNIEESTIYEIIMQALDTIFVERQNVACARLILPTSKQAEGDNISFFVSRLKQLTKDCEFNFLTANEYRNELLLNA